MPPAPLFALLLPHFILTACIYEVMAIGEEILGLLSLDLCELAVCDGRASSYLRQRLEGRRGLHGAVHGHRGACAKDSIPTVNTNAFMTIRSE